MLLIQADLNALLPSLSGEDMKKFLIHWALGYTHAPERGKGPKTQ